MCSNYTDVDIIEEYINWYKDRQPTTPNDEEIDDFVRYHLWYVKDYISHGYSINSAIRKRYRDLDN